MAVSCGPGMPGPYNQTEGLWQRMQGAASSTPRRGARPCWKNKKTRRPLPRLVFFKKKEKNRTSRRRLNANGTTPLQVIPSLRIRQGALVFFLFTFRSEALAFDALIVHLFCRICKMRTCTMCCKVHMRFCATCTSTHGRFLQKAPAAHKTAGARNIRFIASRIGVIQPERSSPWCRAACPTGCRSGCRTASGSARRSCRR